MKKIIFLFLIVQCTLVIDNCLGQWVQVSNGMGNRNVYSLAANASTIFAGDRSFSYPSLYLSTNSGTNWIQTSSFFRAVYSIAVNGNNVFAGNGGNGVYLSTDNGTSWTQTSLNSQYVNALAVNGNNIFAGVYPIGVYLSTNNGY